MRAFRPGRFASAEELEYDAEWEEAKQLNIERYTELARAELPLFDGQQLLGEMSPDARGLVG